jgi:hypothetical protein
MRRPWFHPLLDANGAEVRRVLGSASGRFALLPKAVGLSTGLTSFRLDKQADSC